MAHPKVFEASLQVDDAPDVSFITGMMEVSVFDADSDGNLDIIFYGGPPLYTRIQIKISQRSLAHFAREFREAITDPVA